MKANIRKVLFTCVLIMLGIGIGVAFIHDMNSLSKKTKSIQSITELMAKYHTLQQNEKMNLSSDEDLTVAIMNLPGIEDHLYFTRAKVSKTEYYDLINEILEIRKALLKKLIPGYEGEVWCISKYLLATSYRLMETGTKQLHMGNKKEAYELFEQAYKLYLLFWKLNKNIATITSSDLISFDPDTNNNKFAYPGDIFQSDSLNKSCTLNDSKINCCTE